MEVKKWITNPREQFKALVEKRRQQRLERHREHIRSLSKITEDANNPTGNAWDTLVNHGNYLPRGEQERKPLLDGENNPVLDHKGQEAKYVPEVLSRIPVIFVDESNKNIKYLERNTNGQTIEQYVEEIKREGNLFISFSGFASATEKDDNGKYLEEKARSYREDAVVIQEVVDTLNQLTRRKAAVVFHGGTRFGIPALANTIATEYGLKRLASMPREGLRSPVDVPESYGVPPLEAIVIKGHRYGEETDIIGQLPDLLVCLGGGANSIKEIEHALTAGKTVFLIELDKRSGVPTNTQEHFQGQNETNLVRIPVHGSGNSVDISQLHQQLLTFATEWEQKKKEESRTATRRQ